MGHTRIGRLNRSQKWKDVIAVYCHGAGTEQVSAMTMDAISQAFNYENLTQDAGYQKAVELLVSLGIAAQSDDFAGHMRECGIPLSDKTSTTELLGLLREAVDEASWGNYTVKHDIGDFAKDALCEAVAHCSAEISQGELPGLPARDALNIFHEFGKRNIFAELNQRFIAGVTARSLNSYLAQIIPNLTGVEQRVSSIHEINAAYKAVEKHCLETARVHKVYANDWLGKHNYQLKDITPRTLRNHANFIAMKMLRALKYGKD